MLQRRRIISFGCSAFWLFSGDSLVGHVRPGVLLTWSGGFVRRSHSFIALCIFICLLGGGAEAGRLQLSCGLNLVSNYLNWLSVVIRRLSCCLTLLKQHQIQSLEHFRISNIIRRQISQLVDFSLLNRRSKFCKDYVLFYR